MHLGPRFGAFGLVNMVIWIAVAMAADAGGALPYAPALLIRDRVACTYEGELCIKGLQQPVRIDELCESAAAPTAPALESA